jgi:hypothetical protein
MNGRLGVKNGISDKPVFEIGDNITHILYRLNIKATDEG